MKLKREVETSEDRILAREALASPFKWGALIICAGFIAATLTTGVYTWLAFLTL